MAAPKKVKFILELNADVDAFLDEEAEKTGTTKSDVLRKAVALVMVASANKEWGRVLALIDSKSEKVISHIVGL